MIDKKYSSCLLAGIVASLLPCSTALAGSASSTTWYVSTTGSDFYPGLLPSLPFQTIKRALAMANDGDTIRIYAGIYRPASTFELDGKSISFVGDVHGDGSPATVIFGDPYEFMFDVDGGSETVCNFSNLVLRDSFTAIHGWTDNDASDEYALTVTNSHFISNFIDCSGNSIRVLDSAFYDHDLGISAQGANRLYVDGCDFLGGRVGVVFGDWMGSSDFEVRNSRFTGYWDAAIAHYNEGGEQVAVLADLVISENEGNGVEADCSMLITDCRIASNGGSGVVASNSRPYYRAGCLIEHCTISDNGAYGILDEGREDLTTSIEEGIHVRDSVICGNAIAQVRGGYYYQDWVDAWENWNNAKWDTVGHGFENYWKGSNLNVRRRCFGATQNEIETNDDPISGNDSGDDSSDDSADSGGQGGGGLPGRGGSGTGGSRGGGGGGGGDRGDRPARGG